MPSYTFGNGVSSVVINTSNVSGQIQVLDSADGINSSLTRYANYTELAANTTSSDERFYINNNATSGLTSFGGSGTNDQIIFYPSIRGDLPTTGGAGLYITERLRVDKEISVGTVSGTGVALYRNATTGILTTTSSDIRLKQNITAITGATEIVKNLRGVFYHWKEAEDFIVDDETRQIGLIAQEVENFLPEAVILNGVSDYKTIKYSEMVALLIQSTKEQQEIIEKLKSEVEGLKNRISDLESKNNL